MRSRRRLLGVAGVGILLAGIALATNAALPGPAPTHYTFVQYFDGPAGSSPNYGLAAPHWFTDPCWTTGCGTPAVPTRFSAANAYQDGHGQLVLVARRGAAGSCGPVRCAYTSARLTMLDWASPADGKASFSQEYGTFSARIQAPSGRGFWPAFWLVGANIAKVGWPGSGEIDALEGYGEPEEVQQHVEFGSAREVSRFGGGWPLPAGQTLSGWHTYTVIWSPQGITWQVDGTTTLTLASAQIGRDWQREFEHPFTLVLDLAIGGLAGTPGRRARFPAKMLVAWVKVASNY